MTRSQAKQARDPRHSRRGANNVCAAQTTPPTFSVFAGDCLERDCGVVAYELPHPCEPSVEILKF